MGALTLQNAGLECTLHGINLFQHFKNDALLALKKRVLLQCKRSGARIIGVVATVGNIRKAVVNAPLRQPCIFIIHRPGGNGCLDRWRSVAFRLVVVPRLMGKRALTTPSFARAPIALLAQKGHKLTQSYKQVIHTQLKIFLAKVWVVL